jgi:hypothetical protein
MVLNTSDAASRNDDLIAAIRTALASDASPEARASGARFASLVDTERRPLRHKTFDEQALRCKCDVQLVRQRMEAEPYAEKETFETSARVQ